MTPLVRQDLSAGACLLFREWSGHFRTFVDCGKCSTESPESTLRVLCVPRSVYVACAMCCDRHLLHITTHSTSHKHETPDTRDVQSTTRRHTGTTHERHTHTVRHMRQDKTQTSTRQTEKQHFLRGAFHIFAELTTRCNWVRSF